MIDDLEDDTLIAETEAEISLAEAEISLAEAELKEVEFDKESHSEHLYKEPNISIIKSDIEDLEKLSIEDPVVGMSKPIEKKTIVDRIVGFVEPVIENRFIKKTKEQIKQEEEERLKKGPLFKYRTSKRNIEIDD